MKKLHIVLFEPEIPENTGNIARTCVGFNITLHLIKPYGFFLDNKKMLRSGLDYWKYLKLIEHDSYEDFIKSIPVNSCVYYISRYGNKNTGDIKYNNSCETYLMFGKESTGINKEILKQHINDVYRIPSSKNVRSLNLSNCVAMLVYDYAKQNSFNELSLNEPHKKGIL